MICQLDLILGKIDMLMNFQPQLEENGSFKGNRMKKITSWKSISVIPLIVTLLCFNACTTIQFKAIAPPQPSIKLRVAILPISANPGRYGFGLPHDRWSNLMIKMVTEHLQDTGIYEAVPQEDVNYAVGTDVLPVDQYWWLKDDYALLKQYGKALYADYVMIITRDGSRSPSYKYSINFFNTETRMCYLFSELVEGSGTDDLSRDYFLNKLYPRMYRKLFSQAKGDLLATAIRKGGLMPEEETKKPAPPETKIALAPPSVPKIASAPPEVAIEKKPAPIAEALQKPVPDMKKDTETPRIIAKVAPVPRPELEAADKRKEFEKKLDHEMQTETPVTDKAKLVVYDFDTIERLNVVALILTHALREELFILGQFSLVNRENMMQVMQELKLQHSGLVAEKEIVELGKWLAANQAVTGRLAMLGNSYVLQAARTDIKTMRTLGIGTLKCSSGQEEELLSSMPILARKLIESKK